MEILCRLVDLYLVAIFARIIVSWFPTEPGSFLAQVSEVLYRITEPVMGPIRRVMPPVGVGGMGLDLSPIVVILLIQIVVRPLLC